MGAFIFNKRAKAKRAKKRKERSLLFSSLRRTFRRAERREEKRKRKYKKYLDMLHCRMRENNNDKEEAHNDVFNAFALFQMSRQAKPDTYEPL